MDYEGSWNLGFISPFGWRRTKSKKAEPVLSAEVPAGYAKYSGRHSGKFKMEKFKLTLMCELNLQSKLKFF